MKSTFPFSPSTPFRGSAAFSRPFDFTITTAFLRSLIGSGSPYLPPSLLGLFVLTRLVITPDGRTFFVSFTSSCFSHPLFWQFCHAVPFTGGRRGFYLPALPLPVPAYLTPALPVCLPVLLFAATTHPTTFLPFYTLLIHTTRRSLGLVVLLPAVAAATTFPTYIRLAAVWFPCYYHTRFATVTTTCGSSCTVAHGLLRFFTTALPATCVLFYHHGYVYLPGIYCTFLYLLPPTFIQCLPFPFASTTVLLPTMTTIPHILPTFPPL